MISDPSCPTCGAQSWEVIGRRTFSRAELEACSENRRERLSVLFELWLPGVEPVRIEDVVCAACGLVVFRPRPTPRELDAKYEQLHRPRVGPPALELTLIERKRSRELCAYLRACRVELKGARVLDYGGFRGALMHDLARAGAVCHVVDYAPDVLPGIRKLGSTLDDLAPGSVFDVIVCSHVLEHVAEPRELCARLLAHLSDRGVMYVEVPMEILGQAPRAKEPVTHINFFAIPSLRATLELAGLEPARLELAAVTSGGGMQHLVLRGTARRAERVTAKSAPMGQGRAVVELTQASRLARASLHLRHPRLLWNTGVKLQAALRARLKKLEQRARGARAV